MDEVLFVPITLFKGLRQCADPFKWLLQNRGYEKNYMSAVSTAKACLLQALGFEKFKWLCRSISFVPDQLTSLILRRCQRILITFWSFL